MKAFIVDRYGKKDGGRIGEMPDFESTKEALAYVETGRAKGKGVVMVR